MELIIKTDLWSFFAWRAGEHFETFYFSLNKDLSYWIISLQTRPCFLSFIEKRIQVILLDEN